MIDHSEVTAVRVAGGAFQGNWIDESTGKFQWAVSGSTITPDNRSYQIDLDASRNWTGVKIMYVKKE